MAREVAIGFVGLCIAMIICAMNAAEFPSENFCGEMFVSHTGDFEKLQKMLASESRFQQIGFDRIGPYLLMSSGKWAHREYDHFGKATFSDKDVADDLSLTSDRLYAYHDLCSRLGLRDVVRAVDVDSHRDETQFSVEDGMGRDFFFHLFALDAWLGPRIQITYNASPVEKDPSLAPPGWSLYNLSTQKYATLVHAEK
jgi:hypothetical protein